MEVKVVRIADVSDKSRPLGGAGNTLTDHSLVHGIAYLNDVWSHKYVTKDQISDAMADHDFVVFRANEAKHNGPMPF